MTSMDFQRCPASVLRRTMPSQFTAYQLVTEGKTMPYVNIKITNEGVTKAQKQALIKGATQLLVDVLNKNPATTIVVIDEVETDNWGIGLDQVTELRAAAKRQ